MEQYLRKHVTRNRPRVGCHDAGRSPAERAPGRRRPRARDSLAVTVGLRLGVRVRRVVTRVTVCVGCPHCPTVPHRPQAQRPHTPHRTDPLPPAQPSHPPPHTAPPYRGRPHELPAPRKFVYRDLYTNSRFSGSGGRFGLWIDWLGINSSPVKPFV